jgi:glycosyltransferase involved in cell wall biosynthesis
MPETFLNRANVRVISGSAADGNEAPRSELPPSLGFILIGGALVGAQVRDIRLANELVRRGYPVHVWWAMDRAKDKRLDPAITQRWLFQSVRYSGMLGLPAIEEAIARLICRVTPDALRARILQKFPSFFEEQIRETVRHVCQGVEKDQTLIRRFAAELTGAGVTHLMPTLEFLAPFAEAAKPLVPHLLRYLVTFQGYELYAKYAREINCEEELYRRLRNTVAASDWAAIGVSPEYCDRIHNDVGVSPDQLRAIPPGIPPAPPMELDRARAIVSERFPTVRRDIPLISYVGRRDSEKGLDLLVYAAKILAGRGVEFQLAICGPTAFGNHYQLAVEQVAHNLRCPVLWSDFVSDELRSALFRSSTAVVYPSIHEEPFGMVPVEAMACGTPVIVPDTGGVSGVVQVGASVGGLKFRSWDTRHLADQLQLMICDAELRAELAAAAPVIANHFSVEKLGERVLDHLELPRFYTGESISAKRFSPHRDQAASRVA